MILPIDLFQTDNADSKVCDNVVQSYKRTIKISFKIHSKLKYRRLPDNPKPRQTKYKICLMFCEIQRLATIQQNQHEILINLKSV